MIGKLKGVIDSYGDDWVILDVGGVGYHVFCSAKTHAALPPVGEAAQVFTEMLVSDSAIRLVGFATQGERDWFKLLESVQGVGTKVALAILSVLSTSELTNAIALGDMAMVGRANGVGKKLAQRIVTELKDKAPKFSGADPTLARLQADLGRAAANCRRRCRLGAGQSRLQPDPGRRCGDDGAEFGRRRGRCRNADPSGPEGTGAMRGRANYGLRIHDDRLKARY